MRARALLFGLNYGHCREGTLRGCINDVKNMAAFLEAQGIPSTAYTDDEECRKSTSKAGMLEHLERLAEAAARERLDAVWIHYSGHGSSVRDAGGDELDGRDECLVPSDYEDGEFLLDDEFSAALARFPSTTRVMCVFDCCHSGTMADLRYTYDAGSPTVEEVSVSDGAAAAAPRRVISLSGCLDTQTSADAYDVSAREFSGALTAALLGALKSDGSLLHDAFALLEAVHARLRERNFSQKPRLAASFELRSSPHVLTPPPVKPDDVVVFEATTDDDRQRVTDSACCAIC